MTILKIAMGKLQLKEVKALIPLYLYIARESTAKCLLEPQIDLSRVLGGSRKIVLA